jgi:hypothetical protein
MHSSHRRMLDDNGEPAKAGTSLNTQRKRKYYVKDLDQGVEWYKQQLHMSLHPEEPVSPEPIAETAPLVQRSKANRQRRKKRQRQHTQP